MGSVMQDQNDLTRGPIGDIWFTDTGYGYILGISVSPEQFQLTTYRFRPSTGEVQMIDSNMHDPLHC